MPPLADAMDAVHLSDGSVLRASEPGVEALAEMMAGGRHDRVAGPDIAAMGTVEVIAGRQDT